MSRQPWAKLARISVAGALAATAIGSGISLFPPGLVGLTLAASRAEQKGLDYRGNGSILARLHHPVRVDEEWLRGAVRHERVPIDNKAAQTGGAPCWSIWSGRSR